MQVFTAWSRNDLVFLGILLMAYLAFFVALVWWRSKFDHPSKDKFLSVWRHPALRIVCALSVIPLNMYLCAEDPTIHSRRIADLGLLGMPLNLALGRWPPSLVLTCIKILCVLCGLWLGAYISKYWIYNAILVEKLNLEIFEQGKGQWLVQAIFIVVWMIPVTTMYNGCVLYFFREDAALAARYTCDGTLLCTYLFFYKLMASLCSFGDTFTFIMVVDSMIQDHSQYPGWIRMPVRKMWLKHRVGAMAGCLCVFLGVSYTLIWGNFWSYTYHVAPKFSNFASSELSRAIIAGTVGFINISIVTQDWEFPSFDNPLEVKMAFLNVPKIRLTKLKIPSVSKSVINIEPIRFEGRWFNFTALIATMLLDLISLKGLIFYYPSPFAQYIGPDHCVWTITNFNEAQHWTPGPDPWASRRFEDNGDLKLHALYFYYNKIIVWTLALAPHLMGVFVLFEIFRKYNRHPEDIDRRQRLRMLRQVTAIVVMKRAAQRAKKRLDDERHEREKAVISKVLADRLAGSAVNSSLPSIPTASQEAFSARALSFEPSSQAPPRSCVPEFSVPTIKEEPTLSDTARRRKIGFRSVRSIDESTPLMSGRMRLMGSDAYSSGRDSDKTSVFAPSGLSSDSIDELDPQSSDVKLLVVPRSESNEVRDAEACRI